MKQSSVRLSVCPVDRHQQLPPAGLLLSALRAGDIDRWQAPAHNSKCGQRHVDSRRRRLSTDLFWDTREHARICYKLFTYLLQI